MGYTEQMVADIAGQVLDALDYIHWRGKVYLNLEPANILVCSGRSLGRSVQVKLANFETTQTVASNGTQIKGTYNFDYAAPEIIEEAKAFPQSDVWSLGVLCMSLCLASFLSRERPQKKLRITSFKSDSSLNGFTRSAPWKVQGCSCGSSRDSQSGAQPLRKLVPT